MVNLWHGRQSLVAHSCQSGEARKIVPAAQVVKSYTQQRKEHGSSRADVVKLS